VIGLPSQCSEARRVAAVLRRTLVELVEHGEDVDLIRRRDGCRRRIRILIGELQAQAVNPARGHAFYAPEKYAIFADDLEREVSDLLDEVAP
jgi:hypothetical protein